MIIMEPAVLNEEELGYCVKQEIKTEENVTYVYINENNIENEECENILKRENKFLTEIHDQVLVTENNQECFQNAEILFCDMLPVYVGSNVKGESQSLDQENTNLSLHKSLRGQQLYSVSPNPLAIKSEFNNDISNMFVKSRISKEFDNTCDRLTHNLTEEQQFIANNCESGIISTSTRISGEQESGSQDAEKYVQEVKISTPQKDKSGLCNNLFSKKRPLRQQKPSYAKSLHKCAGCTEKKEMKSRLSKSNPNKNCLSQNTFIKELSRKRKSSHCKKQKEFDYSKKKCNINTQSVTSTESTGAICGICKKFIKSKYNLKRHMFRHENVKNFLCNICKMLFFDKHDLSQHILTHTGIRRHVCDVCKRSFGKKYGLNRHKQLCHGVFDNTGVKYSISFSNELLNFRHFGQNTIKKYFCGICNKSFAGKDNLKKHIIIHDNIKNHMCDICGFSFFHGSDLRKHLLIHAGIKKYSCNVCQRLFPRKSHLISHFPIHNKDTRKYSCADCCESFKTKIILSKHLSKH